MDGGGRDWRHGDRVYLDFLSLVGVLRLGLFEAFGDRKYWNERHADLFVGMLIHQLSGRPITLEDMTNFISGVSHSTKIRCIEDARADGLIEAFNRSELDEGEALSHATARKIFRLSEEVRAGMLRQLDPLIEDVRRFAATLPPA